MTPIEYASLDELQRRDTDTNGLDRQAAAELHRRWLAAKLGGTGRRNPAQLLAELETRRNGPQTPAERAIAMEAKRYPSAHGVDPKMLMLQLEALRISQGF